MTLKLTCSQKHPATDPGTTEGGGGVRDAVFGLLESVLCEVAMPCPVNYLKHVPHATLSQVEPAPVGL